MIDDYDGEFRPGDGVALRFPGVAMLVLPGADDDPSELLELVRAPGRETEGSGRRLARQLAVLLGGPYGEGAPPFALVADEPGALVLFAHGPVQIDVEGDESLSLSGQHAATWVDRIVTTPVRSVRLAAAGDAGGAESESPDRLSFVLTAGVVPAGAMRLTVASAASEPATGPVAAVAPLAPVAPLRLLPPVAPRPTVTPLDLNAGETRRPLPLATDPAADAPAADECELVEGILCSRDHLSNPGAPYCSVCGISLVHRTHNVVVGPRPPLGFLVFDDGSAYTLDHSYVVGRDPHEDPDVEDGTCRPLVIDDADRSISRVQAEIRLDGWDVKLVDRGSTNGTYVFDPERDEWQQLVPDVAVTVPPSGRVAFGSRTFVYETPHRAPGTVAPRQRPARGAG